MGVGVGTVAAVGTVTAVGTAAAAAGTEAAADGTGAAVFGTAADASLMAGGAATLLVVAWHYTLTVVAVGRDLEYRFLPPPSDSGGTPVPRCVVADVDTCWGCFCYYRIVGLTVCHHYEVDGHLLLFPLPLRPGRLEE